MLSLFLPACFSCCADGIDPNSDPSVQREKVVTAIDDLAVTTAAKQQETTFHNADLSSLDSPSKLLGPVRRLTPDWLHAAQSVAIQGRYLPPQDDEVARFSMRALGFRRLPEKSYWVKGAHL